MSAELFFMPGLDSTGPAYPPAEPRMRNLGSAIFLVAIADYRSLDQEAHDHAATVPRIRKRRIGRTTMSGRLHCSRD